MRLTEIGPAEVKRYAQHVAKKGLGYNSVRLAVAPVRAMLACAVEDGVIRSNPASGVRIPRPVGHERADAEQEETAKALTEPELRAFLAAVPDDWRLFFEVLAATGLRVSEILALRWGDVDLGQHRLHVRRRLYDGRTGPPKSTYGRSSVPLSPHLTQALWRARKAADGAQDADPLFASSTGGHLSATNVASRVLKPAARAASVPWASFHTFRHTCATILFRHGANAVQVQRWMGHHSAGFTLATYVHLLASDLPDATLVDHVLGGHQVDTSPAETGRDETSPRAGIPAVMQAISS